MKLLVPKLACLSIALVLFCTSKTSLKKKEIASTSFTLTVERGAFHNDRFVLSPNKLLFQPKANSNQLQHKYNLASNTPLDTTSTILLINFIEQKNFWKLKNEYLTKGSCTSSLVVSLEKNHKIKQVRCEDFKRDCPELLKYIEEKIVELEGNNLKRVYLPG